MFMFKKSLTIPGKAEALPGRRTPLPTAKTHFVNGNPLKGRTREGAQMALFGLGCFWGAERKFWELGDGVFVTAVGYAGGQTPNPTYEEVCSGRTGHNEVVLVVFDPKKMSLREAAEDVLGKPRPDPGHAAGQRCRHAISLRHLCLRRSASARRPRQSKAMYAKALAAKRYGAITTEILDAPDFYFAEDYHQQYLAKNPPAIAGSAAPA